MKETHCIYCGKKIEENSTTCPHCHENLTLSNFEEKDIHHLHQNAHNHITEETDRFNSGMVNLVTGLILLIIGCLFLFLSFKYNVIKVRVFRPSSVEFIVSCICLTLALVSLTFATIKLTISIRRRKFYNQIINDTSISKE